MASGEQDANQQLEYFVAVAEDANFTRAAHRLHVERSGRLSARPSPGPMSPAARVLVEMARELVGVGPGE